jgi:hypothetical protein
MDCLPTPMVHDSLDPLPPSQPFVAIVGLHSSGSSCLAGVIHHLGLHLGNKLTGFYGSNPNESCGFEAVGLAQICQFAIPFPGVEYAASRDVILARLRQWIVSRQREATYRRTLAGGKYPQLCQLGDELRNICGSGLRVVHSARPLEQSIASLARRFSRGYPLETLTAHQRWLWEGKERLLSQAVHLTVEYDDLLADPASQVVRIIDFLQLHPSNDQVTKSVNYVRPERRHIG